LAVTYEQLLKEAKQEQENALQIKEGNQLAIVLYTSGSTGVPKGNTTLCANYNTNKNVRFNACTYSFLFVIN